MPDDIAAEKVLTLRALGADIEQIRAQDFGRNSRATTSVVVSTNQGTDTPALHEHVEPRGFFADQFENMSNFMAHYEGTGPEIWQQTNQSLNAFVSGAGTGGTIAGVACYLKERQPTIRIVLSDPEGSGLYNKVKHGVMYDPKESEGRKRRHQVDTIVEGIGINRLTRNFQQALPVIDDAIRVTDEEAVSMSRYLVKHDGLFLGSSSACNLVAAVKVAKTLAPFTGKRVVTILCDSGSRHYSKFWNDEYLKEAGIKTDLSIIDRLVSRA
ncbi:hypothetical protein FRB91_010174 [Serendipita sp. 411]|nr:hypothetical protein FRC19_006560 [Serendipita sp. 401]KAG8858173.1 hypothetical protein FRB91_010174 [Serendipita sp. 411]